MSRILGNAIETLQIHSAVVASEYQKMIEPSQRFDLRLCETNMLLSLGRVESALDAIKAYYRLNEVLAEQV